MSLNITSFEDLEAIFRDFLWGMNEDGEYRKALVAWEDMASCKAKGGLGFEDF